mgnify:CR=1 FL=1
MLLKNATRKGGVMFIKGKAASNPLVEAFTTLARFSSMVKETGGSGSFGAAGAQRR